MQAVPVIAGILLLGLMTLSGFQLVPEYALSGGSNSLSGEGIQIDADVIQPAPSSELFSGSSVSEQTDSVITAVIDKSTQDIERNTATLRGRIVVGPEDLGSAFFVYGYDQGDVQGLTRSADSYEEALEDQSYSVQVKRVSHTIRRTDDVSVRVGSLAVETDYYTQLCVEVGSQLRCSAVVLFETLAGPTSASATRLPTISASNLELISGEEVSLTINVAMRDTTDGLVYLVYGESQSDVQDAIEDEYSDIDENGDRLQRVRVATGVIGSRTFLETIDDLDDETDHYYAACVEYDGNRDGFVCTRVYSFTTPDDSFGDTPRVTTDSVSVSGNTIALNGSVNMRSFRNGQAFFVYGTNESSVESVEGQRTMTSIRQNGDSLQRVLVDSDVDSSDSFRTIVADLRFSTAYTTRLCIEFENTDAQGRDRLYIECGEVKGFVTN